MQTNYTSYDFAKSRDRMDEILNASNDGFVESDTIPSRDRLTFTNGFYVKCTALFVDIRGSSTLPDKHTRPVLSKLYRSYISEVVAVLNGYSDCKEINIVGDCVSGIFEAQYKSQVNSAFAAAFTSASAVDTINVKLTKKGYAEFSVGIGLDYGRALMIKAGYSGSGINDVVWMGSVVNSASNLCGRANKGGNNRIMLSSDVHCNITEHNQGLVYWNQSENCYHGSVVNPEMEKWVQENKK